MEKIDNIFSTDLRNSHCLIEIQGLHSTDTDGMSYIVHAETSSGIHTGQVVATYNKAEHVVRNGILARMPDRFNWDKASWVTDYFPDEGDEVWFDYLDAKDATVIESKGKKYIVLPYFSVLLALSREKGIRPLNGYLMAQKVPIPMKEMEVVQRYYDDIYKIVYAGKPNISYKDEESVDDKSITEGMTIMTRSSSYPKLEEGMYAKFSKETYYYFQRKDIVAEVKL